MGSNRQEAAASPRDYRRYRAALLSANVANGRDYGGAWCGGVFFPNPRGNRPVPVEFVARRDDVLEIEQSRTTTEIVNGVPVAVQSRSRVRERPNILEALANEPTRFSAPVDAGPTQPGDPIPQRRGDGAAVAPAAFRIGGRRLEDASSLSSAMDVRVV